MKLTPVQREVLLALIDLHHKRGATIKGEDIAEVTKRNPGTIRNQMQALRALGLVEGVPGPKGGYVPTAEGYRALNFEKVEQEVSIPFFAGDRPIGGVTVQDIDLIDISDPARCRAKIHAIGDLKGIDAGDIVRIGPTPVNRLVIKGRVLGRDDIDNMMLIDILGMFSAPKGKVADVATRQLTALSPKMTVRDGAKIFLRERIRGAPIVEDSKPIGMLSTVDVARALAEGREDASVEEVMSRELHFIQEDAPISQAIKEMEEYNISRLIVVDDGGNLKGVITRTDILNCIADIAGAALAVESP